MPSPILLTETLLEGQTGTYSFPLIDDNGVAIHASVIETLTLTLYDLDSDLDLRPRGQDILNVNNGSLSTTVAVNPVTLVSFNFQPADTVILNEARLVEYRVLVFTWSWDLGRRHAAHAVQVGIENLGHVP